ncbi:Rho termination factor [filamentous cyanobacterium CCP5]|nr:Rho termination factor [filamentous cyanobacterium CCP5]
MDDLYAKAQNLDIEGRSDMNKGELINAIQAAQSAQLAALTVDDLYAKAQDLDIEGRSDMNKDELIEALVATGVEIKKGHGRTVP